jgi:isoleucyl-tRNA synthetase
VAADYDRYEFHTAVARIQNFCSEDLGGFYLDILKDRLYTTKQDSRPRRAAQSALYHIAESLLRLIAPILSFTAEEGWRVRASGRRYDIHSYVAPAARDPGRSRADENLDGNPRIPV